MMSSTDSNAATIESESSTTGPVIGSNNSDSEISALPLQSAENAINTLLSTATIPPPPTYTVGNNSEVSQEQQQSVIVSDITPTIVSNQNQQQQLFNETQPNQVQEVIILFWLQ